MSFTVYDPHGEKVADCRDLIAATLLARSYGPRSRVFRRGHLIVEITRLDDLSSAYARGKRAIR